MALPTEGSESPRSVTEEVADRIKKGLMPTWKDLMDGNLHTTENMRDPYVDDNCHPRSYGGVGVTPPPPMPASLKIGPVTYDVICDEKEWKDYEHREQQKGYYGKCYHMELRILLNPEAPENLRAFTLWHEAMHAMFEQMMGSPFWSQDLDGLNKEDQEETIVRRMEYPTLQVLRDNPALLAYVLFHE